MHLRVGDVRWRNAERTAQCHSHLVLTQLARLVLVETGEKNVKLTAFVAGVRSTLDPRPYLGEHGGLRKLLTLVLASVGLLRFRIRDLHLGCLVVPLDLFSHLFQVLLRLAGRYARLPNLCLDGFFQLRRVRDAPLHAGCSLHLGLFGLGLPCGQRCGGRLPEPCRGLPQAAHIIEEVLRVPSPVQRERAALLLHLGFRLL
mmetsp:Transcript_65582/g.182337  ORF Transcript_65582/g.182337 Transcript_65582/m.182337 type:complete len:201 (+) Transcript_65582:1187-1789(+)